MSAKHRHHWTEEQSDFRRRKIGRRNSVRSSERRRRSSWATPPPPAGVGLNPLKDLDLTEGQTFGFPSARLGIPSARFGFPSDWLGFPSAQLGIPSVRLGTASFRPSEAALPRIAFGPGRRRPGWGVTFRGRVTHKSLKSPVSREKNRVNIGSKPCPNPAQLAQRPRPDATPETTTI